MRNAECPVRNAECGMPGAECPVRNAESECGMRNEECGMRVKLGVRVAAVLVCVSLLVAWRATAAGHAAVEPLWDTGTFSILGYDPATGEVGGAVQSRVFS